MAAPVFASVVPGKTTVKSLNCPCISFSFLPTCNNGDKNPSPCLVSSRSSRPLMAAATTSMEVERDMNARNPSKSLPFRIGHGFDLHRLEPGYPLIIGGIDIPHDRGCEAHSDGDVLLHCVVDAILGALGLPDIGQIFPDSDPKWKGAASSVFIKEAVSFSKLWVVNN
ncbi:hypothetical protein HHK36_026041 [Tetracentron sinense]|uniref:2-C-methyl-D-erythritol 2,4-cyclodiphosphate synthase n=1 Tax=Tetracentron sinense TaxID=13715 RepID=A0A834YNQ2_TETSI|nr:hypothetical protein HHK36_026041 [Tetracentron sinense]